MEPCALHHNLTHLCEFILCLGLDSKARDVGVCEAGGVLQLFHSADLGHGLVLLLLVLLCLRRRHLHLVLFIWKRGINMVLVCSHTRFIYILGLFLPF